jgi:hypothetical protein
VVPTSGNNSCAVYPGWNASTNTAGPFTAIADSTGSSIDGNPASVADFTNDGKDSYGFVRYRLRFPSLDSPLICRRSQSQKLHPATADPKIQSYAASPPNSKCESVPLGSTSTLQGKKTGSRRLALALLRPVLRVSQCRLTVIVSAER